MCNMCTIYTNIHCFLHMRVDDKRIFKRARMQVACFGLDYTKARPGSMYDSDRQREKARERLQFH